jgi:beta-phosphoglucomutase
MSQQSSAWAVIWDMDGVLVDSEEAHFSAWSRLFQEEGVPLSRDFFTRTFGQRNDSILRAAFGEDLAPERLKKLDRRKETYYRELVPSHVHLLPGAHDLLKALSQAGARLAIGSSGPRANITATLAALSVSHFFPVIVSGEDVPAGKPAPDIFLLAARRLAVPPAHCLVLEDAPPGVEAALAAGMRCVAITSTRSADELAQAHLIVNSLTELRAESLRQMALSGFRIPPTRYKG